MNILVFARYWEAGRVKTRLCPPLQPAQAADLHRACLDVLLARLQTLPGAVVTVVYGPPEHRQEFAARYPSVALLAERGADLTSRLQAALAAVGEPCLITGSDCPTVPLLYFEQAAAALQSTDDLVLGPVEDGGVYLMGLHPAKADWLADVPWNTAQVSEVLTARAAVARCRLTVLPTWYDVDRPPDLARLWHELAPHAWPHRFGRPAQLAVEDILAGAERLTKEGVR